ncbi:MAG: hypothetical protein IKT78_00860, partial [Ruminiclostridium sp.]|nr:hypothetical protein [Ruminiclostridium sp.]
MDNKSLNDVLFSLPRNKRSEDVSEETSVGAQSTVQFDKIEDITGQTAVNTDVLAESEDNSGYSATEAENATVESYAEEDEDEVTEEEYQQYLIEKKRRAKKIKAKNRHR